MSSLLTGALVAGALVALVGTALAALAGAALTPDLTALAGDRYLRRVVGFTLYQATLSTLLSVGSGVLVARALARRPRFPGRGWLLKLFGLPLVVPSIVAVFGIVAVYGQSGLFNRLAVLAGLDSGRYLYGLGGILIAHVFFNLPLTVRLLLPLWRTIPGESWRLADQLGMRSLSVWRLLEWPVLRQALPGVAGLVFMLCFSSFAVVLTLGGGPAATTIEVAIYQALRFDFDLGRAVVLALLQLSLCALLLALVQRLRRPLDAVAPLGLHHRRPDARGALACALDALLIATAGLSTALPLAAVLLAGIRGPLLETLSDPLLWRACANSLLIALAAGVIVLGAGTGLALAARELRLRRRRPRAAALMELPAMLILAVSPLVLGTGLFVLLAPRVDVFAWALPLVVLINALLGLPYALRLLEPPLSHSGRQYDRLCASLGLRGWQRFRLVDWPLLRRPAGLAAALGAALATGDLGAVALFGSQDMLTLPLLLYQRLGSYQMGQAAATALVLSVLCLALFAVLERLIGGPGEHASGAAPPAAGIVNAGTRTT